MKFLNDIKKLNKSEYEYNSNRIEFKIIYKMPKERIRHLYFSFCSKCGNYSPLCFAKCYKCNGYPNKRFECLDCDGYTTNKYCKCEDNKDKLKYLNM